MQTKIIPVEWGVQLSPEILAHLGAKEGDELFIEHLGDGSISISKGKEIEIDLAEFSKAQLLEILGEMAENNLTFNQWANKALKEAINAVKEMEP